MEQKTPFPRKPLVAAMLGLVSTALPLSTTAATAGRVNFAVGNVTIKGSDGSEKAARKGASIMSGDTIITTRGRAQLKFKDGAYISLQPETEFKVDEYSFSGEEDGSERSFFSLLKGGLRTITGLVGRRNRDSFRVKTPVATIGIRGTEFLMTMGPSLLVSVGNGSVFMRNDAGELVLLAGQSGLVQSPNSAPRTTSETPVLDPESSSGNTEGDDYSSGEDTNEDGEAFIVAGEGSSIELAFAVSSADGVEGIAYHDVTSLNINADNVNESLEAVDQFVNDFDVSSATLQESGGSSYVFWERWTNGPITVDGTPVTLIGDQSLHAVTGFATPEVDMPTSGEAYYSMTGSTMATLTSGGGATGTLDYAELSVNFGSGTGTADFGGRVGSSYFYGYLGFSVNGNRFSGYNATGGYVYGASSGSNAPADVRGFFAGPGAEEAGLIYKVGNPFGGGYFHGGAGLEEGAPQVEE